MSSRHIQPAVGLKSFSCPHCGALANQKWYSIYACPMDNPHVPMTKNQIAELKNDREFASGIDRETREKWFMDFEKESTGILFFEQHSKNKYLNEQIVNMNVSSCFSCLQIAVWKHDQLIFPNFEVAVQPNEDLEDDIRADFEEAQKVLGISPRSAAALLRLCLQKICVQLGLPGKNINDDIALLVTKGLDPRLQKSLDLVRVIGNEAVHPGEIDLRDDRAMAEALVKIVNRIASDLISHPKEIERLYAGLPASKLVAIEKRDAAD